MAAAAPLPLCHFLRCKAFDAPSKLAIRDKKVVANFSENTLKSRWVSFEMLQKVLMKGLGENMPEFRDCKITPQDWVMKLEKSRDSPSDIAQLTKA